MKTLNKFLVTALATTAIAVSGVAMAEDVKFGFIGGFTGPIESLTPPIYEGARIAEAQINAAGGILGGGTLTIISADGACDATAAAAAGDRMVNSENVSAIVGALCSGETIAAANNAAIPGNVVLISPASTSPSLTDMDDNDLVFRTAPSDAYQGIVLSNLVLSKGITEVAITYVNNDYGKGFADAFAASYEASGGTVLTSEGHEDGKSDYRAELGAMASSGAQNLVMLAYANSSGQTIMRQAIESGDFVSYIGGDGMVSDELFVGVDSAAAEGMIATRPGSPDLPGNALYAAAATAAGQDPTAIFAPQAYDAAMILALAVQQKGNADRDGMSQAVRAVSSAPGEVILPGEWAKAVEILAAGGDINYEGASGSHEFDAAGDVPGIILEMVVEGGSFVEVGVAM